MMEIFKDNRRVLYVDDEPQLLNSFLSLMRKENFKITILQDSEKITDILNSNEEYALVLSDQRMPGYDGVKVLEAVKENNPDTIRVLVTGYADYKDTIRAINVSEISSYISKPWDDDQLKRQVNDWVTQYNLKLHNKYLTKLLDEENYKLNELLDGTVAQIVRVLGDLSKHVSPVVDKWHMFRAFDLFNLGVALLPLWLQTSIASNGLSAIDSSPVARNHHLIAANLLKNIPGLETIARIIELLAKNYNGTGEPENEKTAGTDIPFGARLCIFLLI
jgi:response regulator RpfG family c-di-GMP phosphodiesterase